MDAREQAFTDLQIDNFLMFLKMVGFQEVRRYAELYPDRFYPIYFAACERKKCEKLGLVSTFSRREKI